MTGAEAQDLRALGHELAGARQSPWEPPCIADAFSLPREGQLTLTMQAWIELAKIRCPLLAGLEFATDAEVVAAGAVFRRDLSRADAETLGQIAYAIHRAVQHAFSLQLAMQPPEGMEQADDGGGGFGAWLPIWAFLVAQCKLSLADAAAMPVAQVLALIAAHRANQGWTVSGTPYAFREVLAGEVTRG